MAFTRLAQRRCKFNLLPGIALPGLIHGSSLYGTIVMKTRPPEIGFNPAGYANPSADVDMQIQVQT